MSGILVVIKLPEADLSDIRLANKAVETATGRKGEARLLVEKAVKERSIIKCETPEQAQDLISVIKGLGYYAKLYEGPQ